MKVKNNDTVLIIAGKDKGKKGSVMRLDSKNNKLVVEKINIRTKHIKKSEQKPGEIVKFEAPIDVSNTMVVCPNCNKPTRVSYIKNDKNKKTRTCKKCKEQLDKKK